MKWANAAEGVVVCQSEMMAELARVRKSQVPERQVCCPGVPLCEGNEGWEEEEEVLLSVVVV